jgi:hypothetical protein
MVRKNLKNLTGKNINDIVSELIHISDYWNNPAKYYAFFGLQGGTVYQLAGHILDYKQKNIL